MRRWALAISLVLLAACAAAPPLPPDVLILGEQHDAAEHQRLHHQVLEELAARGTLGALALEMAESGHSTRGLSSLASEAQVREALAWDDNAWPWSAYGPAIMTAVRAGVTVAGANLARARMREAAGDSRIDSSVAPEVLQVQLDDVRSGHCGLLAEKQLLPMARMQLARDGEMARVVETLLVAGKTAVLITGARHADARVGVAIHLSPHLRVETRTWPAEPPKKDYCAELRRQWDTRKPDA